MPGETESGRTESWLLKKNDRLILPRTGQKMKQLHLPIHGKILGLFPWLRQWVKMIFNPGRRGEFSRTGSPPHGYSGYHLAASR
jgi:hypothetical protein